MAKLTTTHREEVIVEETGESMTLITERPVESRRPSGVKYDPALDAEYLLVWTRDLTKLGLSGREYDVLLQVAAYSRIDSGESRFQAKAIAEEIGASAPNVSKIVSQLIDRGVLERIGNGAVRINPLYVWRGSNGRRRASLMERLTGRIS
jgi:predicted transcriptional regulator